MILVGIVKGTFCIYPIHPNYCTAKLMRWLYYDENIATITWHKSPWDTKHKQPIWTVERKPRTLFLQASARDWTLNSWSADLSDCTGVLYDLVFWFWTWSCHDLRGIKKVMKHKYVNGETHWLLCFLWSIDINENKDSKKGRSHYWNFNPW